MFWRPSRSANRAPGEPKCGEKESMSTRVFLRREDAEERALEVERRIDRGEPALAQGPRRENNRSLDQAASRRPPRSRETHRTIQSGDITLLEHRLGRFRISELDRERIIQFGKARAREGAGPVTLGIDLGYIKTILSHAAAVHGVVLSTEPIALARIALARPGLVGKGNERDRRPAQNELDKLVAAFDANPASRFLLVGSFALR